MHIEYCVNCEIKRIVYTFTDLKILRRFLAISKKQGFRLYSFSDSHFWLYSQESGWTIGLKLKDLK